MEMRIEIGRVCESENYKWNGGAWSTAVGY